MSDRCSERYPVPSTRDEPFDVTYHCGRKQGEAQKTMTLLCTVCSLPLKPNCRGRYDYKRHASCAQQVRRRREGYKPQRRGPDRRYAKPREIRSWLAKRPGPLDIYEPGSALLADLAYRAQRAGFYAKRQARKKVESALWRHIDLMIGLKEE